MPAPTYMLKFWSNPAALARLAAKLVDQDERLRRSLIQLRKARGISQTEVAEALGVTQPTVAAFERIDADPKLSTLRRYALAVGASIEHSVSVEPSWITMDLEALPLTLSAASSAASAKMSDFAVAA